MASFDDSMRDTVQAFLRQHVTNQPGSYITSEIVLKQLMPFLFKKGMTDKISLNNLPKLTALLEELLDKTFERGDWKEEGEEYTTKFDNAYRDCAVTVFESKRKETWSGYKVPKTKAATGRTFSTLPEMVAIINEFEQRIQALENQRA